MFIYLFVYSFTEYVARADPWTGTIMIIVSIILIMYVYIYIYIYTHTYTYVYIYIYIRYYYGDSCCYPQTWGGPGDGLGRLCGGSGEALGRTWGGYGEDLGRTWGGPGEDLGRIWAGRQIDRSQAANSRISTAKRRLRQRFARFAWPPKVLGLLEEARHRGMRFGYIEFNHLARRLQRPNN